MRSIHRESLRDRGVPNAVESHNAGSVESHRDDGDIEDAKQVPLNSRTTFAIPILILTSARCWLNGEVIILMWVVNCHGLSL